MNHASHVSYVRKSNWFDDNDYDDDDDDGSWCWYIMFVCLHDTNVSLYSKPTTLSTFMLAIHTLTNSRSQDWLVHVPLGRWPRSNATFVSFLRILWRMPHNGDLCTKYKPASGNCLVVGPKPPECRRTHSLVGSCLGHFRSFVRSVFASATRHYWPSPVLCVSLSNKNQR